MIHHQGNGQGIIAMIVYNQTREGSYTWAGTGASTHPRVECIAIATSKYQEAVL
jgi:hypothetical protein